MSSEDTENQVHDAVEGKWTPEVTPDDVDLGAKILKKSAEIIEKKPDLAVEKVADTVYAAQSEWLQSRFDALTDDEKRELLRADDRFLVSKILEKWLPNLDYKNFNPWTRWYRDIMGLIVQYGIVDAPESMIKEMRGVSGAGFLTVPTPALALLFKAVPELAPLLPVIEALKAVKNMDAKLAPRVRARVREMKSGEGSVNNLIQLEHKEVAGATQPEIVIEDHKEAA